MLRQAVTKSAQAATRSFATTTTLHPFHIAIPVHDIEAGACGSAMLVECAH